MAKGSVAFVLVEVDADGAEVPVSEHATFLEGWGAGQDTVHAHADRAYSLYVKGGRRVARFCHHRLNPTRTTADIEGALLAL